MDQDAIATAVARALLERADKSSRPGDPSTGAGEVPPPPPAPPIEGARPRFDEVATRKHIELLTTVLQAFTLRGRALARENIASIDAGRPAPENDAEKKLGDAAARVHTLLVEHPVATRALVSALAAEGRQFAATPEGGRLRERLLRSRLVRRGALLWSSVTMGLVDDGEPSTLPSAYVDVLVELSERVDLEHILGDVSAKVESR